MPVQRHHQIIASYKKSESIQVPRAATVMTTNKVLSDSCNVKYRYYSRTLQSPEV